APAVRAGARAGQGQAVVLEVAGGKREAEADRAPAVKAAVADVAARRAPARPRRGTYRRLRRLRRRGRGGDLGGGRGLVVRRVEGAGGRGRRHGLRKLAGLRPRAGPAGPGPLSGPGRTAG